MTPDDAQARLSPRQRECLHLVWSQQATSKEIARALNLEKPTVDGYIAEAVKALGAENRREASLLAFGGRQPAPVPPPAMSGGDPARLDGSVVGEPPKRPGSVPSQLEMGWQRWLPFRTGATNDLHPAARLVWIVLLTIVFAGSLGIVIHSLVLVSDLLR